MSGTKADGKNHWKVVSISFGTTERPARAKLLDRPPSSHVRLLTEEDLARNKKTDLLFGRVSIGSGVILNDAPAKKAESSPRKPKP